MQQYDPSASTGQPMTNEFSINNIVHRQGLPPPSVTLSATSGVTTGIQHQGMPATMSAPMTNPMMDPARFQVTTQFERLATGPELPSPSNGEAETPCSEGNRTNFHLTGKATGAGVGKLDKTTKEY